MGVFWTSTSYSAFAIAMAAEEVARLVWVVDLTDHRMGEFQRTLATLGSVVDLAGKSTDALAEELSAAGVAGVITFTDAPIPLAANIAAAMGLPYHSPQVAALLTDTVAQRQVLAAAGIPTGVCALVPAGSTTADVPLPAVVRLLRPDRVVTTPAELADALALATRDVVVEELMPDRPGHGDTSAELLSVAAFVDGDEITQVAVVGRYPLAEPFRDTGEYLPSDAPDDEQDQVRSLAARAARAIGVRTGFVHVDVKRTPTGPRVVQVRGRLGYGVPEMVARAGGGDLMREALLLAMGQTLDPLSPVNRVAWLVRATAPIDAKAVESIEGLEDVAAIEGVATVRTHRAPGQSLDTREGTLAHVYVVDGHSPDHEAAYAVRQRILDTVRVSYR